MVFSLIQEPEASESIAEQLHCVQGVNIIVLQFTLKAFDKSPKIGEGRLESARGPKEGKRVRGRQTGRNGRKKQFSVSLFLCARSRKASGAFPSDSTCTISVLHFREHGATYRSLSASVWFFCCRL